MWHIDRGIPITVIMMLVINTCGGVWATASLFNRVDQLERTSKETRAIADRLIRVEEQTTSIRDSLMRLERSIGDGKP